MDDAIALLPIHRGYIPSQPDPSGWAALPPYGSLRDAELAPEAVRSRASSDPEPYRPVTVDSVAEFLAQDPTVSDLIQHLGLPQEVDDALQVLLLRDVPTLLAALSNITEVLDALVENGATTTMRPLLRARFSTLVQAMEAPAPEARVAAKPAVTTIDLLTDGERQDLTVQFERYYRQSLPTEQQPSMWLLTKVVRERVVTTPSSG